MVLKLSKVPSVSDFYKDTDILITGATGFIGLVLIEKLLRSCPDLNKIYAIVRPKCGKAVQERKKLFLESELFVDLLNESPDALDKLTLIEGNMNLPHLGLSDIDRQRLVNVSVVFHAAASIRFDEPLKDAILGHVRGTRDLLELALGFKQIKAFVHVSTAFCNMDNGSVEDIKANRIEEKLYPNFDDWSNVIKLAEQYDRDILDAFTPHFTKFTLNTYLYTKALAENVCVAYQDKIPLVMFRPAIVAAKASPPITGWTNNLNGPYGLSLAGMMGILRVVYGDINTSWEVITVDITVNGMIISACKRHLIDPETAVYNANLLKSSSCETLQSAESFKHLIPMSSSIWKANVGFTRCKYNFYAQSILFHFMPAFVVDTILELLDKKPMLLSVQRKLQNVQKALVYFTSNSFEIQNYNFMQLDKVLNEEDNQTFDIKMQKTLRNRDILNQKTMHCIRRFILKDADETLPVARKHHDLLLLADNIVKITFWSLFGVFYYNYVLPLAL